MTLELSQVGKRYGSARVLDSVSLEVEPGEVVAIVGENGAGKTTLMKVVTGLLPHGSYDGRVLLGGEELRLTAPGDAEKQGIALLPQELLYFPELSVAENVLVGKVRSRAGLIDRRALDQRATELCRAVGLDLSVRLSMRRLETAQRQLVSAARALAYDPSVLVLDEPTAALPRQAAEHLAAVVRRYAARGNTVLYVSHNLEEVRRLADRVTVLRNGRMVVPPTAKLSLGEIVEAMIGKGTERDRTPRRPVDQSGPPSLRACVERLERGPQTVLDAVRFDAWPGEIVGVAGLAGSGREALLRTLAGAPVGKAEGWIEIGGRRYPLRSPARLRRAGLSFLPDDRLADGILPLATVGENVLLGLEGFGSKVGLRRPRTEREAVRAALDAHEVRPPDPDQPIRTLSGGNQQKALLARTGFKNPRVLLFAEPTRGVDIGARAAIYDSIRASAADGATAVVSSGDSSELTSLCDRVIALWRGRIVSELEGSQITDQRVLAAINGEPEGGPRGPAEEKGEIDESPATPARRSVSGARAELGARGVRIGRRWRVQRGWR